MTEVHGTLAPYAVAPDTGEARWWFGSLATSKATAAQTGGAYTPGRGARAGRVRGAGLRRRQARWSSAPSS